MLIFSRISNRKPRIQTSKPKQRGTRGGGDEFQHFSTVGVGEILHYLPEELDGWVFCAIVADDIDAVVFGVCSEVGDVD